MYYRMYYRIAIFISCVALLLGQGVWAQVIPSRYQVAVVDFAVEAIEAEPNPALGRALADAFEIPLVQSKRFLVVTRNDLDVVLEEMSLAQSGVLSPLEAQNVGELLGADILITGSVIINDDASYTVNAKFINIATGQISVAMTAQTDSSSHFPQLSARFVQEALKDYPKQGQIIDIQADEIFINLGSQTGLEESDEGGIIYRVREIAGQPFEEGIAEFSLLQVSQVVSQIDIVQQVADKDIQLEDTVVITLRAVADTAVSSDETEGEESEGDEAEGKESEGEDDIMLFVERYSNDLFTTQALASISHDIQGNTFQGFDRMAGVSPQSSSDDDARHFSPPAAIENIATMPAAEPPIEAIVVEAPPAAIEVPVEDLDITSLSPASFEALWALLDLLQAKELLYIWQGKHQLRNYILENFPTMAEPAQQTLQQMPEIYATVQANWQHYTPEQRASLAEGMALLLDYEWLSMENSSDCPDFACFHASDSWQWSADTAPN